MSSYEWNVDWTITIIWYMQCICSSSYLTWVSDYYGLYEGSKPGAYRNADGWCIYLLLPLFCITYTICYHTGTGIYHIIPLWYAD